MKGCDIMSGFPFPAACKRFAAFLLSAAMVTAGVVDSLWLPASAVTEPSASSPVSAVVTPSALESFHNWKQYAPAWASLPVGIMGDTMKSSGCAVTAAAILCASSGCTLPENFNPGMLCRYLSEHGGFSDYGILNWNTITGLVPEFRYQGSRDFEGRTTATQIDEISGYINDGYYVAICVKETPQQTHFIAVRAVENGVVYMDDPGSAHDSLYAKYDASQIASMRLFMGADDPEPISPEDSNTADYSEGMYQTYANLHLRKEPSLRSDILGVIPSGTSLEITGISGEWGMCDWNGMTGWISMNYCTPMTALYITGNYSTDQNTLNLRSASSISASVIGYVPPQTTFSVSKVSGNWGYTTINGKVGWISLQYCICLDSINTNPPKYCLRYTTGSNCMRLRAAATTNSDTLAYIGTDTEFVVTDLDGEWGKTKYQGMDGWVNLPYCILLSELPPTDDPTDDPVDDPTDDPVDTPPVEVPADTQRYTTGDSCMRLRAAATTESETLAFIGTNTEFIVTELDGNWGKTIYQGKTGWINLAFCQKCEDDNTSSPANPWPVSVGRCVVTASALNIRQAPDISGVWLGRFANGEIVTLLSCEGDWARVQWLDGSGWLCLGQENEPYLHLCGDLTLDGVCNDADRVLFADYLAGNASLNATQLLTADYNGDGIVNASDLALL